MLASERLLDIQKQWGSCVERIVAIELDGEMLRMILYFADGSNLRVTEQWRDDVLVRYSYDWLSSTNELNVGWDNAPHHTHLETFPHHKHVGVQAQLTSSHETCLADVMDVILDVLSS